MKIIIPYKSRLLKLRANSFQKVQCSMHTALTAETGLSKISLKHHILYQIPNDRKYDAGSYSPLYSLDNIKISQTDCWSLYKYSSPEGNLAKPAIPDRNCLFHLLSMLLKYFSNFTLFLRQIRKSCFIKSYIFSKWTSGRKNKNKKIELWNFIQ